MGGVGGGWGGEGWELGKVEVREEVEGCWGEGVGRVRVSGWSGG